MSIARLRGVVPTLRGITAVASRAIGPITTLTRIIIRSYRRRGATWPIPRLRGIVTVAIAGKYSWRIVTLIAVATAGSSCRGTFLVFTGVRIWAGRTIGQNGGWVWVTRHARSRPWPAIRPAITWLGSIHSSGAVGGIGSMSAGGSHPVWLRDVAVVVGNKIGCHCRNGDKQRSQCAKRKLAKRIGHETIEGASPPNQRLRYHQ